MLEAFNATAAEFPVDACLHQLVERQVQLAPDAPALACGDDTLTYAQLNARANRLARHLRGLGAGPDVLVGVFMERSLDLGVALLAILKAGAAYLPLDPAYPPDRIAFMLRDAAAPVLLTQETLLPSLPEATCTVLCLDRDADRWAGLSDSDPEPLASPANLAYAIYTSGSTGTPKGTLVEHRNVVRLLYATQPWFHFGPHDVWTVFHSPAFDFSVWELWGALATGGCAVLVPYLVSRSPEAFRALLARHKVTVLNQTPSAFRALLQADADAPDPHDLALRLVIFGGEALDPRSLKPWVDRHGDQVPLLVNMYGITETTVHVTYRPLAGPDFERPASVIGTAIPDLRLYVLDPRGQPAPIGVAGELHVGGAGLARGYLNRPDLTAEKFIPDPFASDPAARLYKSGDLARWLPDGSLEYLGRADAQVKLRGFRVELGEIEVALTRLPAIREAAVLAREDSPGDLRLVAYLVPADPASPPDPADLRAALRLSLPDYMVPAAFVSLPALPLTPHGKLDRKALPAPDYQAPADAYVAPRTPTEATLAEIFAEVLKIERVSVNDNFFDLGGHSLLATQILSRIRQYLHTDLSLREIFESPTVSKIALVLTQSDDSEEGII